MADFMLIFLLAELVKELAAKSGCKQDSNTKIHLFRPKTPPNQGRSFAEHSRFFLPEGGTISKGTSSKNHQFSGANC